MEHVVSPVGDPVPGGPQVVLPCAGSALDHLDQSVIAWVSLGVFVLARLVELVRDVGGSFGGPACQFLLDCREVGAVPVVPLEAGDQVDQVLPAHPPVLLRDVAVHVLLQPLRREIEVLSCEVDVGDGLSGQQSALRDEAGDGVGVGGGLAAQEVQLALH